MGRRTTNEKMSSARTSRNPVATGDIARENAMTTPIGSARKAWITLDRRSSVRRPPRTAASRRSPRMMGNDASSEAGTLTFGKTRQNAEYPRANPRKVAMASALIGRRRRERKSARKIQPHLLIDASNGPQVRSGGGGRCRRNTVNQEGQSNPEVPGERTDVARCRGPKIRDVAERRKSSCIRRARDQERERVRGGGSGRDRGFRDFPRFSENPEEITGPVRLYDASIRKAA